MEDLVGVDVADAGDHVLVEQQRLEPGPPAGEQRAAASIGVEAVGERVDARGGPARAARRRRGRGRTRRPRRTCAGRRTTAPRRARRTAPARRGCAAGAARPPAASSSWPVMRRCTISVSPVSSGQQQVLAAPVGGEDVAPVSPSIDLLRRRPPHRALATDLDAARCVRPTTRCGEPAADGLDLRQLRHGSVAGDGRRRRASAHAGGSAAACSAAFFERPVPSPSTAPSTTTEAKNRLAWSGPSARRDVLRRRRPPSPAASSCRRDLWSRWSRWAAVVGEPRADQPLDDVVGRRPGRRRRTPRRTRPRARRTGSTASPGRRRRPRPGRAGGTRRGPSSSATSASAERVDDALAHAGQRALGQVGEAAEREVGDDPAEHGVAEELEALVAERARVLGAPRAVGHRARPAARGRRTRSRCASASSASSVRRPPGSVSWT